MTRSSPVKTLLDENLKKEFLANWPLFRVLRKEREV
jgi:hypothetical protein